MAISTDRVANLNYGAAIKLPVKAATTASITLAGAQTVDGVAVTLGDRVLVKDQGSSANGVYDVTLGAWQRAVDFDGQNDIVQGTLIYVNEGTANGGRTFTIDTADPEVGTTTMVFGAVGNSRRTFNVMDAGAVGDGSTADTTAFQAAIDAAVAVNGKVFVPVPSVKYMVGSMTIGATGSYNTCAIEGEAVDFHFGSTSSRGSVLELIASTNGTMFTIPASNASDVGPGPPLFENLWLKGNRTNQSGTSYAVAFTSHTATSNKQRSAFFKRVRMEQWRSGGVNVGTLRNAGVMDQVVILDVGVSGSGSTLVLGSCADWRFTDCDFGSTEGPVVQDSGAGPTFYTQCNFFTGGTHGYKADTSTGEHFFENCSFDRNDRYGVYIDSSSNKMFTFSACRFTINSQETNNTYSDIYVANNSLVMFLGCQFVKAGGGITNFPLNHIETAGTTDGVVFAGCKFDSTAASNVASDLTKVRLIGSGDQIIMPNGSVGAPTYAFDADSGFYRSSQSIIVSINGVAQAVFNETASATRQIMFKAGSNDTTAAPALTVTGGTNTDLRLVAAGTGSLWLGGWTTNADAAVNGYMTVKDSSGTTRKLATIA